MGAPPAPRRGAATFSATSREEFGIVMGVDMAMDIGMDMDIGIAMDIGINIVDRRDADNDADGHTDDHAGIEGDFTRDAIVIVLRASGFAKSRPATSR